VSLGDIGDGLTDSGVTSIGYADQQLLSIFSKFIPFYNKKYPSWPNGSPSEV
jgi:hypothetical protein